MNPDTHPSGIIAIRDSHPFYPFNAFRSLLGIAGAAPTYHRAIFRRVEAPYI